MKTIFALFLLLSASACSQVVFDTCWVYTTIPDNAGGRIEGQRVYIMKTVGIGSNRPLVGMGEVYFETDASGYIRMSLLRNSVVTMRSAIPSLNMLSGKSLTIPDVDSVDLRTLTSATVPSSYVVAVPNPRVRHGNDSARVNTIIFDGAGISSVLFNGQQSATITVPAGGSGSVSDSLDVNAREYVRRLQLRDSLDIIPREKSLSDRLGDRADADSVQRAMTRLALNNDFVSIRSFVWTASDTATNWTTVFQNAIDSTKGRTLVVPPGLYNLGIQGTVPYGGSSNKYCLDLKTGNVRLMILTGATLQLKSGTQTNATGAVEMMIFQDASDIWIGGGGTLSGNTAGQTGWTGGYSQQSNGRGITNWSSVYGALTSRRIVVENLKVDDFFSNPVDLISVDGLRYTNLSTWGTGEGFQCISSRNVVFENLYVTDPTGVSVGDAIELSSTTYFHVDGCTVKRFYSAGQSFDLFGSSRGTLSNFVIDSTSFGIDISNYDSLKCTDIAISNGVIKRVDSDFGGIHVVNGITGTVTISNVLIDSCVKWGAQIKTNATALTILNGVTVRNCGTAGVLVQGNGRTEFNNCNFSNVTWTALQISPAVAGDRPDVNVNGCTFTNSDAGIVFTKGTDTTFRPRGVIRNTVIDNCPSGAYLNDANLSAVDYTYFRKSTNKWYSNSIPWGTDSTVMPNKGYVDTRIAAAGGVSATALRDSLDANARGYVRTNVLADSLRKSPYMLNTPGTLGQIPKVGTGGSIVWAADSAGGFGSGLTNPVDSLRIARIVVGDTIGGYFVDSLKYWYKAIQLPTAAGATAQGWVDLFIVVNPEAVTKAYSYINVVFDSTNTVYSTYGFEAFITSWDNGSGNPAQTEQITTNGVFYTKHSGAVNTNATLTLSDRTPYPFMYRAVRLKLAMVGGAGYTSPVTIRLRCHYRCTAGNTSGWFVKLNDL